MQTDPSDRQSNYYLKQVHRAIDKLRERLVRDRAGKKERDQPGRLRDLSSESA